MNTLRISDQPHRYLSPLVMFQLCDHDQDGCMNPVHILQMLQRLERVFVRETARVAVESQIMLNKIADSKAECNFHFIMAAIR